MDQMDDLTLAGADMVGERAATAHLRRYLADLVAAGLPEPDLLEQFPQEAGQSPGLSYIYPLGSEVFVHFHLPPGQSQPVYTVIEPHYGVDLQDLIPRLETRLVQWASRFLEQADAADRRSLLLDAIDACCTDETPSTSLFNFSFGEIGKLVVTAEQQEALRYLLLRDKLGMGIIEPFLRDPLVEDIRCNGVGPLYLVHKRFGSIMTSVGFDSAEALDRYVMALAEKIGRSITVRTPIVDAALQDGSRINIVYGSQVSRRGSNFSVRRQANRPLSVLDLVAFGTLDYQVLAYLSAIMREGFNFFIAGESASGKTTLLNSLTTFLPSNDRVITIEDTPEMRLAHGNWVAETATATRGDQRGVTLFELVKAALRQRPDAIIVGEIRGEEALVVFQAMQTGHACMSTIHAATVENVFQRLTGHPIEVPREDIGDLHVVVVLRSVRLPDGRRVRRIISICEVEGYDRDAGHLRYHEVFRWHPSTDTYAFTGESRLLEARLLDRHGAHVDARMMVAGMLSERSQWLQQLHARGTTDFYELFTQMV